MIDIMAVISMLIMVLIIGLSFGVIIGIQINKAEIARNRMEELKNEHRKRSTQYRHYRS